MRIDPGTEGIALEFRGEEQPRGESRAGARRIFGETGQDQEKEDNDEAEQCGIELPDDCPVLLDNHHLCRRKVAGIVVCGVTLAEKVEQENATLVDLVGAGKVSGNPRQLTAERRQDKRKKPEEKAPCRELLTKLDHITLMPTNAMDTGTGKCVRGMIRR